MSALISVWTHMRARTPADLKLDSELTALAMINESLTTQGILMTNVKSGLGTLKDGVNALKINMTRLSGKMGSLETDLPKLRKCPACGKSILPEFKLCPHCGEELSLYVLVPICQSKSPSW